MRIRSTKPEFWRSERVARVSWDARLVLKGLESYVDDNGVGRDDIALIVGDLFQRDLVREPSRTLARVSEAISDLSRAGLVWRYEADDTELLYLSFWEQIQRVDKPQPGRFPRPDGTTNYKDSIIRESVANIRESSRALAPGTGEQGNRGTGEQSGGGDISTSPATVPELLENAGLPPEDHESFLQALKDRNITSTSAYIISASRDDTLVSRIKEWQDERDRASRAPRVIQANVRAAPRDGSGRAVYEPALCPHDGEVGRCPMCRESEGVA